MALVQPRTKSTSLVIRIGLVAASLTLTLTVIEVGLRIAGVDPVLDLRERVLPSTDFALEPSPDADQVYSLVPGAQGQGEGYSISINSAGMRDVERTPVKPKGVRRILIIGDSVTFGVQIEAEDAFPALIEKECEASGLSVEVFNMGVMGYDTGQALAFLKRTGVNFNPDVVVLAHCMNDLAEVRVDLELLQALQKSSSVFGRLRIVEYLRLRRLRGGTQSRETVPQSNPPQGLDDATQANVDLIQAGIEAQPDAKPALLNLYTEPWRILNLREDLAAFASIAEIHGFVPLVAVLPVLKESPFLDEWGLAYKIVLAQAQAEGLTAVSLAKQMARSDRRSMRLEATDPVHFNRKGHQVAAQALFRYCLDCGLLTE